MLASFVIFKPDNKRRIPVWLVYFGNLFLLMLLVWISRKYTLLSESAISTILAFSIIGNIGYIVYCYVSYQTLYGKLDGHLEFGDEYFVIEGKKTDLADVHKIDLYCWDYYGRSTTRASIEKRLSQGVGNFFEYTDDLGIHRAALGTRRLCTIL